MARKTSDTKTNKKAEPEAAGAAKSRATSARKTATPKSEATPAPAAKSATRRIISSLGAVFSGNKRGKTAPGSRAKVAPAAADKAAATSPDKPAAAALVPVAPAPKPAGRARPVGRKAAPPKAVAASPAKEKTPAAKPAPGARRPTAKPAPVAPPVASPIPPAGLTFEAVAGAAASDNLVTQMRSRQFELEPVGEHRPQVFPPAPRDLPAGYNDTKLVLLARDPEWLYAYWEVAAQDRERCGGSDGHLTLRVYDVTDIEFDGANAHSHFDTAVGAATNWYIHLPAHERHWIAELGQLAPDGAFVVLARSNSVAAPRLTVSPLAPAEEWMTVETDFERIFELSGGRVARGVGGSETAAGLRRVEFELTRMTMGSELLSSGAMLGRDAGEPRSGFRLTVNAELIVYGATEPDATVTIQDHPVRLNPDGTFRLRLALPDGVQSIPVRAVRADGGERREVTPIVSRSTK